MLLGEPPRTPYDLNFRLLGFPVRVHPMFWLVAVLLGLRSPDAVLLLLWIVAVFVSILIHELGHAAVMRTQGYRPSITLYAFGGLASYGDAPGGVPPPRRASAQVAISLAGPGAQLLLVVVLFAAIRMSGHEIGFFPDGFSGPLIGMELVVSERLHALLAFLIIISAYWAVLNLMPVYPLDGGQVARELLQVFHAREGIRRSLQLSIFTAVALACLALAQWGDYWIAVLFGYLAYLNYLALKAYSGRQPW